MLGHALQKTECFGFPLEYAHPGNLTEWKRRFGTNDFHAVMQELQQRRTSPNGVFGIKIHYPHIKQFGGFEKLKQAFPDAHYILLSRKDLLKQAVSLSVAHQTGVWITGQKPINEHPVYDFEDINRCLRQTILHNASWRYTLAANGCNFIEMDFDHVRHHLAESIERIAQFVGVTVEPGQLPQQHATKKQGNDRNKEWTARFVREFQASNELLGGAKPGLLAKIRRKLKRGLKS